MSEPSVVHQKFVNTGSRAGGPVGGEWRNASLGCDPMLVVGGGRNAWVGCGRRWLASGLSCRRPSEVVARRGGGWDGVDDGRLPQEPKGSLYRDQMPRNCNLNYAHSERNERLVRSVGVLVVQ